jgi:hypothetical protein
VAITTTRQCLGRKATLLKKSWLLLAAMYGKHHLGVDGIVPEYQDWSRLELQQQVSDLEDDLLDLAWRFAHKDAHQITRAAALEWLAERFDEWEKLDRGLFVMSTAWAFEQNIAPLQWPSEALDFPPYAELLLEPGLDVAFRHPEYMLARHLEQHPTLDEQVVKRLLNNQEPLN